MEGGPERLSLPIPWQAARCEWYTVQRLPPSGRPWHFCSKDVLHTLLTFDFDTRQHVDFVHVSFVSIRPMILKRLLAIGGNFFDDREERRGGGCWCSGLSLPSIAKLQDYYGN